MRVFFVLFSFIYLLNAFNIPTQSVANGKTAIIFFDKKENIHRVQLGKKSFKTFPTRDGKHLYALVPIDYYQKPTTLKLRFGKEFLYLDVKSGNYAKEEIHVDNSKVNPKDPAVKKRTAREYAEAMKIYNTYTPKNYVKTPFILPLHSKITSAFGKARVYNNTLKGYHSGTDFRAKMGTPIIASNDGVVVLAQNRFYSGNSIILDHGQGVYTCYYHLSKFKVKKGDVVKKGEVIGLSGDTGRITGPHLHFSARVGGVQVDPLQLVALLNTHLYKE